MRPSVSLTSALWRFCLLLVRVKSRFRAFEKVVRHGVECVSLAWISAPFEALVIFDAQEHEGTLVPLGDRHRVAQCLGEDVAGFSDRSLVENWGVGGGLL